MGACRFVYNKALALNKERYEKKEKRPDFPEFHKKGRKDSFRIPQGFHVDNENGCIKLPKIGWMRYRRSREIAGTPKNVTVTLVHGKAFISIQTEREVETPCTRHNRRLVWIGASRGSIPCRTATTQSNCHRSNNSL